MKAWIKRAGVMFGAAAAMAANPASAQEWEVTATPYIWATGLDGDTSVLSTLPPVEVDDDFGDVLENLDIGVMAVAQADNGKIYLRSDVFFASVTSEGETPGNVFSGAELNTNTFNISAAAGLVATKSDAGQLNLYAGARLWNLNNEVTFFLDPEPGPVFEDERTFIAPMVGANGRIAVTDSITATATASLGGFGVSGADLEVDLVATLAFDIGENWGVTAGYRYLYLDYENDDFIFDLAQHGPLVGAYIQF